MRTACTLMVVAAKVVVFESSASSTYLCPMPAMHDEWIADPRHGQQGSSLVTTVEVQFDAW